MRTSTAVAAGFAALFAAAVSLPLHAADPATATPRAKNFDSIHRAVTSPGATGESLITEDVLRNHVTFLARDEHEGRKTGKGKLEGPVADYIEGQLRSIGLAPQGDAEGTTYRQPFRAAGWPFSKHDAEHERQDFSDPANFGHAPNSRGVAIGPDGRPVTVEPLSKRQMKLLEGEVDATPNTFNLIGLLEGQDPQLKDEIIVVGAHMDHIGMSRWGGSDRIYNGADDNGSGSSALMALASALTEEKSLGNGPARSILFCWFSGEEMGLLGSQYFAGHPSVQWSRIKAMVNIDMIGRAQPGRVSVYDGHSRGDANLFHRFHDTSETTLQYIDHNIGRFLSRSDQYPFYRRGVPVVFFFEGMEANGRMNPDYHGLGDHADKLDITKMADITRFAYRHILGAANLD